MSEQRTGDGQAGPAPDAFQQLVLNAQYIKDLSFENPRAPQSLFQQQAPPQVDIHVDVKARNVGQNNYEVVLTINSTATAAGEPIFLIELVYAALVTIQAPEPVLQTMLLVETPRIIFPFARAVVANATRDGGFPPLMINPIDFAELLRREQSEGAAAAPGATPV